MTRLYTQLGIAAALFALSVAGYGFAHLTVSGMGAQAAELDAQIAVKGEELKNIQEARSALTALAAREANIQAYFIEDAELVSFLENVGSVGEAFGAEVEVLGVTESTMEDRRSAISLALSVSGSFDAVMRTIGALEHAPYDITLSNLAIDAVERAETGSVWAAQVSYEIGTRTP